MLIYIFNSEYGTKEAKMGFLIEIRNENRRD